MGVVWCSWCAIGHCEGIAPGTLDVGISNRFCHDALPPPNFDPLTHFFLEYPSYHHLDL